MMREKSGRQIPLMECSANMGDYLKGMDDNQVQNLINEANESGAFAGLENRRYINTKRQCRKLGIAKSSSGRASLFVLAATRFHLQ
jgi:hypothetical protein